MRTLRVYCETLESNQAVLDGVESRHLSKVLRLGPGDEIEVFDGKGLLANAVVEHLSRDSVLLRLVKKTQIPPKTSGRVILAVSIAKGERFDWMIEKCTELGADHIAAVQYDRTVKCKTLRLNGIKIALTLPKWGDFISVNHEADTLPYPAQIGGRLPATILLYGDARGAL
jgi:16S rRNA (uracil1498-N3)-methyltransferase